MTKEQEADRPDRYVDVEAILNGTFTAPQTSIGGRRSDGVPLLYAAAVNVLLGAPEAGKTLVAGAMAADELFTEGRVLWVDLDHNGAPAILTRFRQYGVAAETLIDPSRFRLSIPEDAETVMAVVKDATTWNPTLAVVDSIGELLPLFGASSNDSDDYTRVHRAVLTALARTGTGVLAIDHEAKGTDSRNYGATGTMAKKRAVDGALIRVTNVSPFTPGRGGEAQLSIVKDRHGALRAISTASREPIVCNFTLDSRGDALLARFPAPMQVHVPRSDLDELHRLVPPPSSVRDVKERMRWGGTRATRAFQEFKGVPGTPGNVPGTGDEWSVPVFPVSIDGERGTLVGNHGGAS
ncbi:MULTISPECIES: AAA family ATPase [unclassified Microbacterium]|uniref:AAA family ATPase n=1 Tax=unclassified Microbacterium TaxID=2609290 RepID=UPI001E52B205|nr:MULTISPECIES: AAA family ATPase [unclassified Microbacterium]